MNDWRKSLIAISICLVVGVAAVMTPWLVNSVYTRGASPITTENTANNNNNANVAATSNDDDNKNDEGTLEPITLGPILVVKDSDGNIDPKFMHYDAVLQYFGEPRIGGWWENLFVNEYKNIYTKDYQTGMIFSWDTKDEETALKNGWVDDNGKVIKCGGSEVFAAHSGAILEIVCDRDDIKWTGIDLVDWIIKLALGDSGAGAIMRKSFFGTNAVMWSSIHKGQAFFNRLAEKQYGNYIILEYPDGRIQTLYGHLQQIPIGIVISGRVDIIIDIIRSWTDSTWGTLAKGIDALAGTSLSDAVDAALSFLEGIRPKVDKGETIAEIDEKNWWEKNILKRNEYLHFEMRDSRKFDEINKKEFVWNPIKYFQPLLMGNPGTNFAAYDAIVYEKDYEYTEGDKTRSGYHPKLVFHSWMAGAYPGKIGDPDYPDDPDGPGDPDIPPPVGGFASPIGGVTTIPSSMISFGFGKLGSYSGFRDNYHTGFDLKYGIGTPLVAPADGTVKAAGWNDSYGNYIVIDHGSLYTLYAHLSTMSVSAGDAVSQFNSIGQTGNSGGNTSGPHLHFEIFSGSEVYWNDSNIYYNPEDYLPISGGRVSVHKMLYRDPSTGTWKVVNYSTAPSGGPIDLSSKPTEAWGGTDPLPNWENPARGVPESGSSDKNPCTYKSTDYELILLARVIQREASGDNSSTPTAQQLAVGEVLMRRVMSSDWYPGSQSTIFNVYNQPDQYYWSSLGCDIVERGEVQTSAGVNVHAGLQATVAAWMVITGQSNNESRGVYYQGPGNDHQALPNYRDSFWLLHNSYSETYVGSYEIFCDIDYSASGGANSSDRTAFKLRDFRDAPLH